MIVSEVMTRDAVCCIRTTSVTNAARMMREFDIGILPVIEDLATRKLMGIVTDRDLCLGALGEPHDPTLTTVEDCMATDLVTFTPDTDVRDVLAGMMKQQVRRVPVVDRESVVRGMVGISDLIRHNAVSPQDIYRAFGRIMAPKDRVRAEAA